MKTNINKFIAIGIFLFLFLVPFRMCFFTDEIVSSGKFIGLFMTNLVGFLIAFGIGTNEPFGKSETENRVESKQSHQYRKAA